MNRYSIGVFKVVKHIEIVFYDSVVKSYGYIAFFIVDIDDFAYIAVKNAKSLLGILFPLYLVVIFGLHNLIAHTERPASVAAPVLFLR